MKYFCYIFFLFIISKVSAQDDTKFRLKNSISATCIYNRPASRLSTIGVSVNYDRRCLKNHASIGTGFVYFQRGLKGIPFEFNCYFFNKKNHIETGLAYTFLFRPGRTADMYSFNLGYRYENFSQEGMIFKFGFNPGLVGESRVERVGVGDPRRVYRLYFFTPFYFGAGYSF